MTSHHRLTLGNLVLSGADLPETSYAFSVAADDLTWGDAEPIERTIRTLLQDGAVTVADGLNNRTATFLVNVEGPDSQALARGEAALAGELGKPNLLTWSPPDGWGPATVFEVFTSSMDHLADDLREIQQCERVYRVRLVCHPTARAESLTEVAAILQPDVTPASTTIDAGNALTNWNEIGSAVLSDGGAYLQVDGGIVREFEWVGSVNLTGTPYVTLDVAGYVTASDMVFNGQSATRVATIPVAGGFRRSVWRVDNPGSSTRITFRFETNQPAYPISFLSLLRWDLLPVMGTGRQKIRTVDVHGSARTQGSLELAAATSLGDVMVYTWTDTGNGYSPSMRVNRSGGGTVTGDAALVSGSRENIKGTPVEFEVPAASLVQGTHLLVARLNFNSATTNAISWTAQVEVGGTPVGQLLQGTRSVAIGSDFATYRFVVLGRMVLPPSDLPDASSAKVALTIDATLSGGATTINLDEAWLLNTTIGAVTIVKCGTGTAASGGPSRQLWLDTPSTSHPRPSIFRGHLDDRSDAFFAGANVESWGVHEFVPPVANVLTVTTNAADTEVSYAYYPRFHTHAYDPAVD